jgi:hypothetical protein
MAWLINGRGGANEETKTEHVMAQRMEVEGLGRGKKVATRKKKIGKEWKHELICGKKPL